MPQLPGLQSDKSALLLKKYMATHGKAKAIEKTLKAIYRETVLNTHIPRTLCV